MTSVSAIVPTFNRAALLREAIESLLRQTTPPAQIIVADDGSSDDTRQALDAYAGRVEHFRQENAGKPTALNRAMKLVRHEHVWIFDDDDLAAPTALQCLYEALSASPAAGFSYSDYDHLVQRDGRWTTRPVNLPRPSPEGLKLAILERCFIFQPGMLVRKSCYDELGPFDESQIYSEDYEMLLRLSRRFDGVRAPGIAFHQRQHPGPRGPARARLSPAERLLGWANYDSRFFRSVYAEYRLAEFLPGASAEEALTPDQSLQALVNRCAVMARKGLWELAGADLELCAQTLRGLNRGTLRSQDLSGFTRVFGVQSYALLKFAEAPGFLAALRGLPGESQAEIRAALLRPLPTRLRYAARDRNQARILELWRVCRQLVTPHAFINVISGRPVRLRSSA